MSVAADGMADEEAPIYLADASGAPLAAAERGQPQFVQGMTASVAPTIGAVSLMGVEDLGYASMSQAFAPFIGQAADPLTLQTLARTLAEEARSRGYMFATARVPDQAMVMGVVRVQIELGRIDQVRVLGSTNRRLLSLLKKLEGSVPITADLERRLLLAGDLPGIVIQGSRFEREHGVGVLEVRVASRSTDASITVDTYGPRAYGPARVRLSGDVYDLGSDGSRLNVQVTRALDGEELTYAGVRYSATILDGAGVVGGALSLAQTNPGIPVAYQLDGDSRYASLYASLNLVRRRKGSVWLNGDVSYLGIDQGVAGQPFRRERTLAASANLYANHTLGAGWVSGQLGITKGVLPAGRLGVDGLPSPRPEARSVFTKVTGWVSYFVPIKRRTHVRVTAMAQAASKPLPNSQEMSLGGPSYGRAYDFSERFGDQGVAASVEISHDLNVRRAPLDKLQVYGFADAGKVTEHGVLRLGEGELQSAGAGVRLQKGRFDLAVEAALPLNTDRYYSGDRSPRVNAQARWRF